MLSQDELRLVLRPGLESLNWNSLGIPDFIKKCEQEINKFQSVVNQIQKNASMIGMYQKKQERERKRDENKAEEEIKRV